MENSELTDRAGKNANHFKEIFLRLLDREVFDLYEEKLDQLFEVIAGNLLSEVPERKYQYFDGVVDLTSRIRKNRQVAFEGEMWVGQHPKQWKEKFIATVTDKESTNQGIFITIEIGIDKAQGELIDIFGITK